MKLIFGTKRLLFVLSFALLLVLCFLPQVLVASAEGAILDDKAAATDYTKEESVLSDEDTEKALDIIHAADGGLDEGDKQKLMELGLTENQIQMLQGLSKEAGNVTELPDGWTEKEPDWRDMPAALLILFGAAIAAVMIVLIWCGRAVLLYFGQQKKSNGI